MGITASIDISAEQRRILLDLLNKHLPNTRVWAFGSRVKWTTRSNSDLDLVAFATPQQAAQVSALKEAFEESCLPFRVDLLVWDKLPESFQRNIREEYVVLVEANIQGNVGGRTLTPTYDADWSVVTLRDAGVTLIDCDHKTPKAEEEGFPYIGIPQLKQGHIVLDGARLISEEDFHLWRRKAKPLPNDVILSRRCNPGETAYVPNNLEIALGQNLVLLRSDGSKLYPPFLRWVVQGPNWWNQVSKFINVGAVFDSLKCAHMPDFEITLPPMESQIQISKILGVLDDKIALNRQTNQTLEQIAQAIFKSWFVDFEPVRAKVDALSSLSPRERAGVRGQQLAEQAALCAISGKTPEQLAQLDPQTLQQLKTTAALFPDALVDSELGEIPEGWAVGKMEDCCIRVESGGTPKRSEECYWGGDIKWLTSGEVRDVIVLDTKEKITEEGLSSSSAKLWPQGSTVVAMYGATAGQICLLANEMTANQACCALIPKANHQSYLFLSARRSIEGLAGKASGSAQQNLNKSLVAGYQLLIPPEKLVSCFDTTVIPLLERWINNITENVVISEIRDTLLPKLLSGEINLSNG